MLRARSSSWDDVYDFENALLGCGLTVTLGHNRSKRMDARGAVGVRAPGPQCTPRGVNPLSIHEELNIGQSPAGIRVGFDSQVKPLVRQKPRDHRRNRSPIGVAVSWEA